MHEITIVASVVAVLTFHGGFNVSNDNGLGRGDGSAQAMVSTLSLQSCSLAETLLRVTPASRHYIQGTLNRPARQAQGISEWCYGFIPVDPSHCVEVEEAGTYEFEVRDAGGVDATMMLRSAPQQMVYCDDDSAGDLMPRLEVQLAPGTYELYIGTYNSEQSGNYSLSIGPATAP